MVIIKASNTSGRDVAYESSAIMEVEEVEKVKPKKVKFKEIEFKCILINMQKNFKLAKSCNSDPFYNFFMYYKKYTLTFFTRLLKSYNKDTRVSLKSSWS